MTALTFTPVNTNDINDYQYTHDSTRLKVNDIRMVPSMELCFPVLKFSHATGVRSDNTIPWTHLSASDLYVVVDGVSTRRLGFRIIQKTTVLVRWSFNLLA